MKKMMIIALLGMIAFSGFADYQTDKTTLGYMSDFTARLTMADQILAYTNTVWATKAKSQALAGLGRIDDAVLALASLPVDSVVMLYRYNRKEESVTAAKAALPNLVGFSAQDQLTLLWYATANPIDPDRNTVLTTFFDTGNFNPTGAKGVSNRLKGLWRRYDRSLATVDEYKTLCESALKNIELTKAGWSSGATRSNETEPFLSFIRGELEKLPSQ